MPTISRIGLVFALLIILSGCITATPTAAPTAPALPTPTATPQPTAIPPTATASPASTATPTQTPAPSATPLPSPTPTITPTPLPFSERLISPETAAQTGLLGVFGRGAIRRQILLAGGKMALAATPLGLFFYDYPGLALRQSLPGARVLAVSPDGASVMVLTDHFEIGVVDALAGGPPRLLDALVDPAKIVAGLPEPNVLYDKNARYCGRDSFVTAMVFSADGGLFAAALVDGEIGVWQVAQGKLLARLQRPVTVRCEVATNQLAFSPDGTTLLTHEQPGHFVLWQIAEQKLVWYLRFQGQSLSAVPFTPDGKFILTQSNSVSIREARFGRVIYSAVGTASPGSISPDGKMLVIYNRQVIQIITLGEYPAPLRTIATGLDVKEVSFSLDSRQVLVNGGEKAWQLSDFKQSGSAPPAAAAPLPIPPDQALRLGHLYQASGFTRGSGRELYVWGASATGAYVWEVTGGGLREVSMSPLGPSANLDFNLTKGLFAACTKQGLEVASLASGTSQKISHCFNPQGDSLALSPDGSILARASAKVIDLIDPSDGQVMHQLFEHSLPVVRLLFAEDGATLGAYTQKYTGWGSSEFSLWQVSDLRSFGFRGIQTPGQVTALAISGDALYLALSGDKLRLWQTQNAEQVKIGEEGGYTALAFSPDGKLLAAGNNGGEIVLYSIPALKPLARFNAHSRLELVTAYSPDGPNQGKFFVEPVGEVIQALAFTGDGANLISLGKDGLLKVWGLR